MKRIVTALVFACGLLAVQAAGASAFDAFLRIEGVSVDVTDNMFPASFEVLSYTVDHGLQPGGTKPAFDPLTFTKRVGRSTATLALAAANGQHFKFAVLEARRVIGNGAQAVFFRVVLKDVTVKSYRVAGQGAGDPIPTEVVELGYSTIEWQYIPQISDGTMGTPIRSGWDVVNSKPF
jgi:type VI secretion system Hcp family effector